MKKFCCKFGAVWSGLRKKSQYIFRKRGGGGSKAVRKFSENTSVLPSGGFPNTITEDNTITQDNTVRQYMAIYISQCIVLYFAQFGILHSFQLAQFSDLSGASLDRFFVCFRYLVPLILFEKLSFLFGTERLFLDGQYIFGCDSEHSSTGSIKDGQYGHNFAGKTWEGQRIA